MLSNSAGQGRIFVNADGSRHPFPRGCLHRIRFPSGAVMQLVTRLLLRLFVIGLFMLMVAAVFNLYAARQDIADEVRGSQSIGQLITTLSELQGSDSVDPQIAAIDELNRSERLRHFHVALLDESGQRLTLPPYVSPSVMPAVLNHFLASDAMMNRYALSLKRSDGRSMTLLLEPNPQSESSEAITGALLQLALFGALGLALIIAIWVTLRIALAPLSDILAGIARIEAGDYATHIAASGTRELNQIAQALNHLATALTDQIARQRELLHRLQDVQEEERRKLAHELHDEFGQLLTAIQVDASYLLKQSAGQTALETCAQAMYENSSSILSQLRSLLAQLRPYGLQGDEKNDIALEQALRDLVRQRQSRGPVALDCRLSVHLDQTTIPQRLAVAVYRIAQEALTNVAKHAEAGRVSIVFSGQEIITLMISDDDKGFDGKRVRMGIGLSNIRDRANLLHGSFTVSSKRGKGTTLGIEFPRGQYYRRKRDE
jgi:two-component system sensor histidine kinase UhpB